MDKKTDKAQGTSVVRTIITNAVYGRATKKISPTIYISPNDNKLPTQVLGCSVTGSQIKECSLEKVSESKVDVKVDGSFEVHVWYEFNGDTHVIKSSTNFSEVLPVKCLGGEFYDNKQVMSWLSSNPKALGTMVINKSGSPTISIDMEYELSVEVIGEAKINILSYRADNDIKQQKEGLPPGSQVIPCDYEAESEDDD